MDDNFKVWNGNTGKDADGPLHAEEPAARGFGLAFALDPDGYWIELVRRQKLGWSEYYNLSQTMLRVKDGPASVEFYTKHLGMTLLRQLDFPQWKFSLYFLASMTPTEVSECFPKEGRTRRRGE
eukprot:g31757.t1